MAVTLTDEQYGAMMKALLNVANGYWWGTGSRTKRLSRIDCIETCRRAAIALGYDWRDYQPRRERQGAI